MFEGPPTVRLEEGGKRLVIEQKVKAKSKPTAMWYFMNKPIKHGGKYFLDVAFEKDTYFVICEILNVSVSAIV